ncbi:MAG: hypothetical protein HYV60_09300 [Planctomycetia bacterium]|nr:hypothetical protein [Planctomycetia bacterium]
MTTRFQRAVDQELSTRSVSFPAAGEHEPRGGGSELAWRPYTQQLLEQLTSEKKTVFVDFTADW